MKNLLKDYTVDEICQSIKNYTKIVNGDEYYFTHIWTLTEFLIRGFHSFEDWDICNNNFRSNKSKKSQHEKNIQQDHDEVTEKDLDPLTYEQQIKIFRPQYGWDWDADDSHIPKWELTAKQHGMTLQEYGRWRREYSEKNGSYSKSRSVPECEPPGLEAWDV